MNVTKSRLFVGFNFFLRGIFLLFLLFLYLCDVGPMALRCFSAGGATDEEVDPVETTVLLAVTATALLLLLLVLLLPLLVVLLLLPVTL